jgi:hypothetical protein
MLIKLSRVITAARYTAVVPGQPTEPEFADVQRAWAAVAA